MHWPIRKNIICMQGRTLRAAIIASWIAALVLCVVAVVSPHAWLRLVAVMALALILTPTLTLALRQVERERWMRTFRRNRDGQQPEPPRAEDQGVYVDQPTGLASRRYLMMFLQREISRSERAKAPLSVAVFDVDDYHQLEAGKGPEAATEALADMGDRLKSALRDYDLLARYADGRIAAVLPETGAEAAAEVVQRLHEQAASVCVDGKRLSVTVGVAAFPENGATAEELINSAHRTLNRGKAEAANQVHIHEGLPKAA